MLSLVATAVVAVVFEPVRRRVQRWADRLVYGDAAHAVRGPRPAVEPAQPRTATRHDLFTGLASTVADGVGAAEVTLWVGAADELVAVATWPPPTGDDAAARTPRGRSPPWATACGPTSGRIIHQGSLRGAVTLTKAPGEALTASEDRLLNDLAAQAGLVIDNVGLGVELQERLHQISLQAAELRAAAKRIVAAQDEARRRIERDLHDGAQQRLVTLALSLQADLRHGPRRPVTPSWRPGSTTPAASCPRRWPTLREMARGIHPAILTQEGLEAAVGFLAERAPLPVRRRRSASAGASSATSRRPPTSS